MTLEELRTAWIKATKEKNKVKKMVISDLINTATNMAIARNKKDNITEDIVDMAILKVKKTTQEQIDTCPSSRPDMLSAYTTYMKYVDEFAPIMMTEDEVRKVVYHIIETADLMDNSKAAIMGVVIPRLRGKAEGRLINKIVTEILNGNIDI